MGRFTLLSVGVWLLRRRYFGDGHDLPGMVLEIGGIEYLNWGLSLYEVGAIIAGVAAGRLCARFGVQTHPVYCGVGLCHWMCRRRYGAAHACRRDRPPRPRSGRRNADVTVLFRNA